eukprot:COSAG06_NODE_6952_length_2705_cov_1.929697_4_plen_73_part_00
MRVWEMAAINAHVRRAALPESAECNGHMACISRAVSQQLISFGPHELRGLIQSRECGSPLRKSAAFLRREHA